MRHTLSILVENRFGELSRIVGLFSARGYNIESLTVAETLNPTLSRMTLVTTGNDSLVPAFRSMGVAMLDSHNRARPLRDILFDIAKWAEGKDPAMVAERLRQMGFDQTTIIDPALIILNER